ncbi:MFS transporter [Gracilibacillus timonensis]|uniref:MFS transporter n=1 Tax=Gracilibacillus timonensis TaxID=1816696 RepID=UPI0009903009|nr:MFS transporter [Gracilibacillus timonensis]
MTNQEAAMNSNYHTAKIWQIALFTLNNTATNLFLFAIGFVTYYATGIAGLTVVVVSTILTTMRVFDGITDPIIGFILDKIESKFGKFRPIQLIGNIILIISFITMYNLHHLPEGFRIIAFIVIHAIYILGYTMQTTVTRAAQTVLTNHPKQRPIFSLFDSIFNVFIFSGGQVVVSNYLVPKHGGDFTMEVFLELNTFVVIASFIFTILSMIAIKSKDRKEFYGLANVNAKTRFRDYWPVLKNNRPMQMLVLSASTDKLASQVMQQQPVYVMLFGIMLGNYALSGHFNLIIIIPSLIMTYFGVSYARKKGMKLSLVRFSWIGVVAFSLLIVMFLLVDDPTIANFDNFGLVTIIFILLYSLGRGVASLTPAIVIPMIADAADYETYRSKRFVPGMMSALFSLVDKVVSSLAPAIVGFLVALIGYHNEFPQIGESLTTGLFAMTLIASFGVPIIGWLISIIAMKFYQLDKDKMQEVQEAISKMKEAGAVDMSDQDER